MRNGTKKEGCERLQFVVNDCNALFELIILEIKVA